MSVRATATRSSSASADRTGSPLTVDEPGTPALVAVAADAAARACAGRVAEALYRAVSLIKGLPYHRA